MLIRHDRLDPGRAALVVIDVQEKLLPLIDAADGVLHAIVQMVRGAILFDIPILVTEQYPRGLGPTHPAVRAALSRVNPPLMEKATFSACGHEPIRRRLLELDRDQIILAGIETHVCIQQTTLDLRLLDYDVFVCADAVGARRRHDHDIGLLRMRQAGALVTTVESALFEVCERCDAPKFKGLLEIIKSGPS